jgi:RNA polymerase sigma-70 factor (ECF subfamily)
MTANRVSCFDASTPDFSRTALPPTPDPDALDRLTQIVRAERGALTAIARSEGLGPEDAVDCVQEGLCTLLDLTQTGGIDPAADPAAVLTTIVRNAARNGRRRHFRARPHEPLGPNELPDPSFALPEDLLSRAEDHVRLRACVSELCEIQRAVVTLRMLEERPGDDVAQTLGISAAHVAVLLYRAKQALRACMT